MHNRLLAQANSQPLSSSAYIINGVAQPSFGAGGSVLTTSRAAADLTTGTLKVRADAGLGNETGPFSSLAYGRANWRDTITFTNSTSVNLDFSWQTDAAITPKTLNSSRFVTSSIYLTVNNQNFSFIGMLDANGNYVNQLGGAQYQYFANSGSPGGVFFTFNLAGNNDNGAWHTSLGDGVSGLIAGTLVVPTGKASIDIDAFLEIDCRNGATCDYANTSTFSFGALPSGLSWTSESGVFLSNAATPGTGTSVPGPTPVLGAALTFGWARRLSRHVRWSASPQE